MKENKNATAFPMHKASYPQGLTKLEYASIMIAQGIMANKILGDIMSAEDIAQDAISVADELLKQLAQ